MQLSLDWFLCLIYTLERTFWISACMLLNSILIVYSHDFTRLSRQCMTCVRFPAPFITDEIGGHFNVCSSALLKEKVDICIFEIQEN